MHSLSILATILAVVPALAFPGLRPGGLRDGGRRTLGPLERRAAEPYSLLYPYTGAKINGLPGLQIGGVLVPATGDTAHQFQPPPPGAYRGPWYEHHVPVTRDVLTFYFYSLQSGVECGGESWFPFQGRHYNFRRARSGTAECLQRMFFYSLLRSAHGLRIIHIGWL